MLALGDKEGLSETEALGDRLILALGLGDADGEREGDRLSDLDSDKLGDGDGLAEKFPSYSAFTSSGVRTRLNIDASSRSPVNK